MQAQIRRVGVGLLIGFIAIFIQLNYVQIFAAEKIANNRANVRALLAQYSIKRGDILTADLKQIAVSKPTGGKLKYVRSYPGGSLYGHLTGFYSLVYGNSGIEESYNDQLLGESSVISMQDIEDRFLGSGERGDDVRLTIDSRLQEYARAVLGNQQGAIVALDPRNGEVRAMYGNPSYDPTPLASHDSKTARRYWRSLDPASPDSPMVAKATARGFPPGSTFKAVTTAAALDSGRYTRNSRFPDPVAIPPCSTSGGAEPCLPQTNQSITNFTRTSCVGGGTIDLFTALTISCDTTFAIIGLEIPNQLYATAQDFGFNQSLPFDIPVATSRFPKVPPSAKPFWAYLGIGQYNIVASPLQMALVAATVANDGVVPRPRLVQAVLDPAGGVVQRMTPETLGRAVSSQNAAELTAMMVSVVRSGTGTAAQIPGVEVAGKTGTAQGAEGALPTLWFIAFAPADNPKIAVAVVVEEGGGLGAEAAGGLIAAPMARQIIQRDRELRGW